MEVPGGVAVYQDSPACPTAGPLYAARSFAQAVARRRIACALVAVDPTRGARRLLVLGQLTADLLGLKWNKKHQWQDVDDPWVGNLGAVKAFVAFHPNARSGGWSISQTQISGKVVPFL